MGAGGVILVILLLAALIVGGYFGYTKLYKPYQCVNKSADKQVSTWMWNSKKEECVANVCVDGFTGKDCSNTNTSTPRKYKSLGQNACTGGTPGNTITESEDNCKTDCDKASCSGYDWSGTSCTIITGDKPSLDKTDTTHTCNVPKSKSKSK